MKIKEVLMKNIFLFVIILILAGCAPNTSTPVVSISPTPTYQPTTNIPAPMITPTIRPSETLVTTFTPTQTTKPVQLIQNCVDLSSTELSSQTLSGRVAFTSSNPPYQPPFLLDLATGEKITFGAKPDEQVYFVDVSPDHKWISLMKNKITNDSVVSKNLFIIDYDGNIQASIQFEPGWMDMHGWADSSHVVIVEQDKDDFNANLIILNPFTKEESIYSTKLFPGIDLVTPGPWGFYFPPVVINPTLNYLVYATSPGLSIWDLASGKEQSSFAIETKKIPTWSTDGAQLAIVGQLSTFRTDLFISTPEGDLERVTYLDDYFRKIQFARPSWSTDNRYIGFGMIVETYPYSDTYSVSSLNNAHLAVLDTLINKVIDYCIPYYSTNPKPPLWAHGEQQVIITQFISWDKQRTYIVDLPMRNAIKLLEDRYTPIGWVSNR
jgi:hypothetical protein